MKKLAPDAAYENGNLVAQDLLERIKELLAELPRPDTDEIEWDRVQDTVEVCHTLATVVAYLEAAMPEEG